MRKIASGSSLKPHIRPAGKEDFDDLMELENICFKEEKFHKKQLEYLLFKARSIVFVASTENNIVASIIVLTRKNISHARIYSLNVHPDYRRQGIAGLLMDTAEQSLKERGFKKISLEVGVNNKAAQSLYISKGFSTDKIMKKYYKNGDDALHLIKEL
ncbi:MAG: GNAT family N-acetyltransferase [Candidatus Methanoperedens sp.]|nr:GNAT family N-acetyltransferase [Candidatus Methanoperedens sp.]